MKGWFSGLFPEAHWITRVDPGRGKVRKWESERERES